jgi:hypothetical protein
MSDDEFVAAFERGEIASFHHREHLRLAWACLRQSPGVGSACERMRGLIRRFAAAQGHAAKYHETMTQFWVRLLGELHARSGDAPFEAMIADNPAILDKDFVLRFYPRELLASTEARNEWIAPPLLSIAGHAAEAHPRPAEGHARGGAVPGTA